MRSSRAHEQTEKGLDPGTESWDTPMSWEQEEESVKTTGWHHQDAGREPESKLPVGQNQLRPFAKILCDRPHISVMERTGETWMLCKIRRTKK